MISGEGKLFSGIHLVSIQKSLQKFTTKGLVLPPIDLISLSPLTFVILLPRTEDPFSRLRVPRYRKAFEAAFFVSFLILYYAVLVERNPKAISPIEVLLYIWIAAFSYDEFSGINDAGMLLYRMDFWSLWNIGIIGTGMIFVVTST